jgi:hypothetical protein
MVVHASFEALRRLLENTTLMTCIRSFNSLHKARCY